MQALILAFLDVADLVGRFLDAGGWVLSIIALVIFMMWAMSLERAWYLQRVYPQQAQAVRALWQARSERHSWEAHQIRRALIAGVSLNARLYLPSIKTLVVVCPLFGLMGTVTGMIAVFDVMASAGMGNPRLMAAGVSQATIPTMAGMIGALSGVFVIHWLEQAVATRVEQLSDQLTMEGRP